MSGGTWGKKVSGLWKNAQIGWGHGPGKANGWAVKVPDTFSRFTFSRFTFSRFGEDPANPIRWEVFNQCSLTNYLLNTNKNCN